MGGINIYPTILSWFLGCFPSCTSDCTPRIRTLSVISTPPSSSFLLLPPHLLHVNGHQTRLLQRTIPSAVCLLLSTLLSTSALEAGRAFLCRNEQKSQVFSTAHTTVLNTATPNTRQGSREQHTGALKDVQFPAPRNLKSCSFKGTSWFQGDRSAGQQHTAA